MLAAASNENSALGLFEAILRTANFQTTQANDPMKAHVIGVIQQAIQIVADPSKITRETMKESIELALRFRDNADLSDKLAANVPQDSIPDDIVQGILHTLQPIAA